MGRRNAERMIALAEKSRDNAIEIARALWEIQRIAHEKRYYKIWRLAKSAIRRCEK